MKNEFTIGAYPSGFGDDASRRRRPQIVEDGSARRPVVDVVAVDLEPIGSSTLVRRAVPP